MEIDGSTTTIASSRSRPRFGSTSGGRAFPFPFPLLILWLLLQWQMIRFGDGASSLVDRFTDDEDARHGNEMRLRRDLGLPLTLDGRGELLHNYSHVLPPHNKTNPVVVQLQLSIIHIRELDTRSQTLTMEGWLTMIWSDPRFRWNPGNYGNISVIRLPDHQIWQPDIKIYTAANMAEIDVKGDVYCLLHQHGEVIWVPPVTMHTICEVDLKNYPYDSHWCTIKLGSWTHSGHEIDLALTRTGNDTNDVSTDDLFGESGEWQVVDTSAERNVKRYECCDEPYADVTFKVHLRRRSPLYSVTILCPIVAAIVLALVAFLLPPYASERITVNAVSLVALVLVLKNLSDIIPPVGSRSPIVAAFCGDFTILVAISTAYSIYVLSFLRTHRQQPVSHWVRVILNSPVARWCCLGETSPTNFAMAGTSTAETAKLEVLHDADDPQSDQPHRASIEESSIDDNQWTRFFKFVDRVVFVFFVVLTLIVFVVS